MRKLLLTTASVLALGLGSAHAANESTVDQNGGPGNTVNVDQTTATNGTSDIFQDGSALNADVMQSDSGTGDNADVDQFGDDGVASVTQINNGASANTATILQASTAAYSPTSATISQEGDGNVSTIEQGITNAFDGSDPATANRSGQVASSTQIGTNNDSLIDQKGNLGEANVFQDGTNNKSTVTQGGFDNQVASVSQTGSDHVSEVSQSANFGFASVTQTGTANSSSVTQSGRANDSEAYVTQGSTGNDSTVIQTSIFTGPGSANQVANVTQTTNDNVSLIEQDGGPNPGSGPFGNTATVNQTVTSNSMSTVMQSGAGNTATVNQ